MYYIKELYYMILYNSPATNITELTMLALGARIDHLFAC